MKRYFTPIVTILVLLSGLLLGCGSEPASNKSPTHKNTLTPKVIEKDVEIVYDWREREVLPFYLKVGDRVEGVVSLNEGTYHFIIGEVRDPYGNVVVQTSGVNLHGYFENSGFPWRFAFIAYTDGEYELRVLYRHQVQRGPSAHLKITIYEGD